MDLADRASFGPPPSFRRRLHFLRKSQRAALSAPLVGGEVAEPVARELLAAEPPRGRWFLAAGGGCGRGWAGATREGGGRGTGGGGVAAATARRALDAGREPGGSDRAAPPVWRPPVGARAPEELGRPGWGGGPGRPQSSSLWEPGSGPAVWAPASQALSPAPRVPGSARRARLAPHRLPRVQPAPSARASLGLPRPRRICLLNLSVFALLTPPLPAGLAKHRKMPNSLPELRITPPRGLRRRASREQLAPRWLGAWGGCVHESAPLAPDRQVGAR